MLATTQSDDITFFACSGNSWFVACWYCCATSSGISPNFCVIEKGFANAFSTSFITCSLDNPLNLGSVAIL